MASSVRMTISTIINFINCHSLKELTVDVHDTYLDDADHIVTPEKATKMIRQEYDENGRLVQEMIFFNSQKLYDS